MSFCLVIISLIRFNLNFDIVYRCDFIYAFMHMLKNFHIFVIIILSITNMCYNYFNLISMYKSSDRFERILYRSYEMWISSMAFLISIFFLQFEVVLKCY
jgi:hypothetical protein